MTLVATVRAPERLVGSTANRAGKLLLTTFESTTLTTFTPQKMRALMATSSMDITINASAEDVWAILADFPTIAMWVPMIQHSCSMTQETSGVGATRRVQIAQQALVETVTVWEPQQRLAYTIEGMPPIVGIATTTWTLQPTPKGTRVTISTEIPSSRNPAKRFAATKALERMSLAARFMTTGLRQEAATRGREVTQ